MRTRHRIPMIFSLSMMDVFCCTLGCVILLWLINQREAMKRTHAAAEALGQLTSTRAALETATRDLSAARRAADDTRADLAAARTRADELTQQLGTQRDRAADAEDRLAKKTLDAQQLTRQRTEALRRAADLDRLLSEREAAAAAAASRTAELTERLEAADARAAQLKKQADLLPDVRDAAVAADSRAQALERDLTAARRALGEAQSQRTDLAGQLSRVRQAAEQRFEGIALGGRRVVFLVDMSGSMDLIDDKTPDAAKWPGVRDTLLRVMRSLPQLEKFQVILFSDKVMYLLGGDGRWIDFDATASPAKVNDAMSAIRPKGNTNMYAGLDATFQFRAQGLDTVYLFSDGLPNIGEGLPPQAPGLTETQRTDQLARTVRTALKTRWNRPEPGKARVRVNAVGFFYESPEVGAFLWALSRENDGSFVGMSRP